MNERTATTRTAAEPIDDEAHKDRLAVLRPRGVRRGIVLASGLLVAAMVTIIWFDAEGRAWHAAYLATAAIALAGFGLLGLTVRAHLSGLDERLAAARDAAYRTSYRILAPAIAIALFTAELAWDQSWGEFALRPEHLRALLLAFVTIGIWLPAAVLAWSEPDT